MNVFLFFDFKDIKEKKITITRENVRENVTFFRSAALFHDSFVVSLASRILRDIYRSCICAQKMDNKRTFLQIVNAHSHDANHNVRS